MPRVSPRLVLRSLSIAAGFVTALVAGCVFYVDETECGPFAYDYRGSCFCEDGYEGDDPYVDGCSPVVTFLLTDDCNDEQDVYWKLYSDDRDWSWPAGESTYLTPGFGIDQYQTITCEFEEWICFGAETSGGLVYGVGLDFGADCSDCCFRCESGQIDLGFLTCN